MRAVSAFAMVKAKSCIACDRKLRDTRFSASICRTKKGSRFKALGCDSKDSQGAPAPAREKRAQKLVLQPHTCVDFRANVSHIGQIKTSVNKTLTLLLGIEAFGEVIYGWHKGRSSCRRR